LSDAEEAKDMKVAQAQEAEEDVVEAEAEAEEGGSRGSSIETRLRGGKKMGECGGKENAGTLRLVAVQGGERWRQRLRRRQEKETGQDVPRRQTVSRPW
jgi:hypothetical protein